MTTSKENLDTTLGKILLADTPYVQLSKDFKAPIEKVWQAWSDAELIKQWWGPETYSCPFATLDFHIGGKYLYAMKAPNGKTDWGTGTYQEIHPNELIVYTDQFADKNGKPISPKEAGMQGDWGESEIYLVSVKFEKVNENLTNIQLFHEGIPANMHDDCVQGWSSSLDKMKAIVEKQ